MRSVSVLLIIVIFNFTGCKNINPVDSQTPEFVNPVDSAISIYNFWQPVNSPSLHLSHLCLNSEGQMFVLGHGESNQLFRSPDTGRTWESFNIGFDEYFPTVAMLEADYNNNLYTSIYNGMVRTVLKSTNDGESWFKLDNFFHAAFSGLHFFGNTIYVASGAHDESFGGLQRSTDLGETWEIVFLNQENESFHTILKYDSTLYAAGSGFYKSTDDGFSWRKIYDLPKNNFFYGTAVSADNTIYHASHSGLFITRDFGENYNIMFEGERIEDIYWFPPGIIIFIKTKAITWEHMGTYLSNDGGLTWRRIFMNDEESDEYIWSIKLMPDGYLYAVLPDKGLLKSANQINYYAQQ